MIIVSYGIVSKIDTFGRDAGVSVRSTGTIIGCFFILCNSLKDNEIFGVMEIGGHFVILPIVTFDVTLQRFQVSVFFAWRSAIGSERGRLSRKNSRLRSWHNVC